jgi:CyaY protein
MVMDEKEYLARAEKVLRCVVDAFDSVDPDEADVETSGDVVTMVFPNGKKCVLNTQRPARQLWLAGGQRAWHFSYDATSGQWRDDKGGDELFATLSAVIAQNSALAVRFASDE